jgi:transmembrane sensor
MMSRDRNCHEAGDSPREDTSPEVIEQAADWFGRREVGLSAAEEAAFARWIEADVRHAEAYREMNQTWESLDGLRESAQRVAAGRRDAVDKKVFAFRRRTMILPLSLAAAAAVAITFVTLRQPPATPVPVVQHASAGAGGMRMLELPDQSVLHLNANSAVEVQFTPAERQVVLVRGEAHFTVTKNSTRPFVVVAGDVSVQVVGTAFGVRLDNEAVAVIVTEGTVSVSSPRMGGEAGGRARAIPAARGEPSILTAGQRAVVPLTAGVAAQTVVVETMAGEELARALDWRVPVLEFDGAPLAEVVAQFNLHNVHQLEVADADLALRPFGGNFRADNYAGFVRLLEMRFGVIAERQGDRTVLRQRAAR